VSVIDAHVHLWRIGRHGCAWPTPADGVLFRDWTMADLQSRLDGAAVARALLVQSQEHAADTEWLLEVAAAEPRIAGVVGWGDLADRTAVERLADRTAIKGLRPMVQNKPADWFDRPDLATGLDAMTERGLVLDALVRPLHLPALARLARSRPALAIVVDHAAKPAGEAGLPAWREAIAPLAACAAVRVKLSGLLTELPARAVPAVVEDLAAWFGWNRLIWGSDWPVLTAVSDYGEWLRLARTLVPAAAAAPVFGGTATRTYRLDPPDA
jgi:L-fuconolactonase